MSVSSVITFNANYSIFVNQLFSYKKILFMWRHTLFGRFSEFYDLFSFLTPYLRFFFDFGCK